MTKLPDAKELMARYELSTYLDGLRDALEMTKPQIRKAIDIIVNSEDED